MAAITHRVILMNEYITKGLDKIPRQMNLMTTSTKNASLAHKKLVNSMGIDYVGATGKATVATTGLNKVVDKQVPLYKRVLKGATMYRWALVNLAMAGMVAYGAFRTLAVPAIQLESEMANVRKTTGFTREETDNLRMSMIELSKTLPMSAKELAQIAAVAGQLGIGEQGVKAVENFTNVVAMMTIATEMSAEVAAKNLAKISQAFDIPISNVNNLGSVINELSNTTAATSTEIVASMLRVGAAGANLGITAEFAAALGATLVDAGMRAERSGCYDKETEVLTDKGWEYFRDVDIKKDKIMTLNPENKKIEWQYATKYVEKDWTGNHMIHYKSKDIDLLVTPDHRMWNKLRNKNDYEILSALDLKNKKRFKFQKAGDWIGKNELVIGNPINNSTNNYNGKLTKLVRLFGYFLSEGYLHKHDNNHFSIDITQNEGTPTKSQMFQDIKTNFKCLSYKKTMSIHSRQLYNYLKKMGFEGIKSGSKFIPKEWKELSPYLLEELLQGMIDGDGCKKRRNVVWTTSKRLADDIQEICIKLGRGCNISKKDYDGLREFPNGEYHCKGTLYNVYFKKKSDSLFWNERGWGKTTVSKFIGKVYCAVVPNGVMMVRRNGKSAFCGNTRMRSALTAIQSNMKRTAEIAGMTTDDFKKLFAEDANKALMRFFEGLERINKSLDEQATLASDYGRVGAFVLQTLGKNVNSLKDNVETANEEWETGLSLLKETSIQLGTTANQWQILTNNIKANILANEGWINSQLKTINLATEARKILAEKRKKGETEWIEEIPIKHGEGFGATYELRAEDVIRKKLTEDIKKELEEAYGPERYAAIEKVIDSEEELTMQYGRATLALGMLNSKYESLTFEIGVTLDGLDEENKVLKKNSPEWQKAKDLIEDVKIQMGMGVDISDEYRGKLDALKQTLSGLNDGTKEYVETLGRLKETVEKTLKKLAGTTEILEPEEFASFINEFSEFFTFGDKFDVMRSRVEEMDKYIKNLGETIGETLTFKGELGRSKEDLLKWIETSEKIDGFTQDLKDVRTQLSGVGRDLSDVRKRISDVNKEISTIKGRRFTIRGVAETNIIDLITRQELELKRAEFAALGLGTAEEFLSDAVLMTTDEIDAQTDAVKELTDAASDGQSQFEAWKTTLTETIRALLVNSQDLDRDVTDVVRNLQTQLLSVSEFRPEGVGGAGEFASPMEEQLNRLRMAQDIFFGEEKAKLDYSEMQYEDRVNGVNESADAIITALEDERSKLTELKVEQTDLMETQQDFRDDIDDLVDTLAKLEDQTLGNVKAFDDLKDAMDISVLSPEMQSAYKFAEGGGEGRTIGSFFKAVPKESPFKSPEIAASFNEPGAVYGKGGSGMSSITINIQGYDKDSRELAREVRRELVSIR